MNVPAELLPDTAGERVHRLALTMDQERAFRGILESAEPAQVECDQERPKSLRWRSRVWRIHHAVGPERLAGDWWRDPYARDYWRCEEDGGATLVVYRRSDGEWFVQGWSN